MKYKSEIIKEIIDRRGHTMSSPHYESECIETWINENKGSYPKLTDYQSEWLNYIEENPNGIFPYVTLSDVTDATIENVVPYAYKSAILKGNTLVNLISDGEVTQNAKNDWVVFSADINVNMLKTSTDYTLITYVISNSFAEGTGCTFGVSGGTNDGFGFNSINVPSGQTGIYKIKLKTKDVFSEPPALRQQIFNDVATGSVTFKQVLVEGDYTNVDIPFFEGMKSVQMPVLTTTGKNLYNKEIHQLPATMGASATLYYTTDYIPVLPDTTYTKSNNTRYEFYDINKTLLKGASGSTFTTSSNTRYVRYNVLKTEIDIHQLETGSDATPYEPFKSNILSTPSDLELRGIGDVQDTLNCLTGEMTERIGEVVLDGSENWVPFNNFSVDGYSSFIATIPTLNNFHNNDVISIINDKFASTSWGEYLANKENETVWSHDPNKIGIRVKTEKASDVEGFKAFLLANNVRIQYQLITGSIKTVDLIVTNQDDESLNEIKPIEGTMKLLTSSDTIQPLFSGEIPVEAITQNLASFIEE